MIDEKTLRLSTNPQVIATLLLIDEVRQLKEVLGKGSNLVFLDSNESKAKEVSSNQITNVTEQSDKPKRGRKKVVK